MKTFACRMWTFGLTLIICLLVQSLPLSAAAENESERFGHQAEPTTQLRLEHDLVLKLVDAADRTAARLRSGDPVSKERLADMHAFFVNFVDACHHAKEERYYFPVALVADPALRQTAATLELHHEIGRSLLSGLDRALAVWEESPELARREAADNLTAYATLLRRHVELESQLFNKAETALSVEQRNVARAGFHYLEAKELGEGFHGKYHALAMKILKTEGY